MKTKRLYFLVIIQATVFLSSCSSLDGLRFWKSDEIEADEPRELISFSNQKSILSLWDISFEGENEIGNFEPGFSSQSLFFSDSEGTVSSIDIDSGAKNWSVELSFLSSGTAAGYGILVVADIDGNVIALDQKDGSKLWTTNVKGEVLSKAAIDTKIIVIKAF